ncbi:hypothetical protein KZ458_08645, partial [Glaesserella parasuis]|nr:hypothetical protein [Glaesserella parasuis]MCT8599888.1 hypothetical protein [Glaesserella parasuis]MCT8602199.1 hypothetical protein [Glaesserella parasuis]
LHKTKNKITRIFQLLSIKVRNNRRKSNESGDLDKVSIKTNTPNSRPKKVTSEIILRWVCCKGINLALGDFSI